MKAAKPWVLVSLHGTDNSSEWFLASFLTSRTEWALGFCCRCENCQGPTTERRDLAGLWVPSPELSCLPHLSKK